MLKQTESHRQIQQLIQFSPREKLRDVLVSQFLTLAEQFIELSRFIDEMQQIKCATSEIRMAKTISKSAQELVRSHLKKNYKMIKALRLKKDKKKPTPQIKYYPKRKCYKRFESCTHLQIEEYYQNVDPCNEIHQVEYDYVVKNENNVLMNPTQLEYGPSFKEDHNTMYGKFKTKATFSSLITACSSCECCEPEPEKQNIKIKKLYNLNDCKRNDTLKELHKQNLHELKKRVEIKSNEAINTFSFESESIELSHETLKNVDSCIDGRTISSVDRFRSCVHTIANVPTINANCAVGKSIDQSEQALSTELRAALLQLKHYKNMENKCTQYGGNSRAIKSSPIKVIEPSNDSSDDESMYEEIKWNDDKVDMWTDLIRKIKYVEGAPKRAQKRKKRGLPLRKSDSMSYCLQQIMTTGSIIMPKIIIE
ncbi:uncharacterized protein LOC123302937 [Chrysoperla carnea]|uniref:uncharacterized protein LOC123302937 n=1 Tax=Chrysoperla carnea TaxID=189513 RepID=UPI001D090CB5|nr:uncharacterized protein LOC123302937 [Chrysoperla carnea]